MASTDDTSPQNPLIEDGINWQYPAKKRKPRITSFIICFLTASGIIAYAFIEKTIMVYQAHNDTSPINLSKIKTGTISTCYTRKPKTTYPVFFHLGFGLLGIIFGTAVDRFFPVCWRTLLQTKSLRWRRLQSVQSMFQWSQVAYSRSCRCADLNLLPRRERYAIWVGRYNLYLRRNWCRPTCNTLA